MPIKLKAFAQTGAAAATVVSQAISAGIVLRFLTKKAVPVRLNLKQFKPDASVIREMSARGVSPFVMGSTEALIGFVLNGQVSRYGGDIYVSALTIIKSVLCGRWKLVSMASTVRKRYGG